MKTLAILLVALSLAGCASPPPPALHAVNAVLADDAFGSPTETIATGELFELSPAMRAYMNSPGFRAMLRKSGRGEGLVNALYAKGELALDYDASETRTAAATFATKSGNCLSLVIMTGAFAQALGIEVTYQEVLIDELWLRQGSLYFASAHVNLALGEPPGANPMRRYGMEDRLVVDFIPSADASRYRTRPIDRGMIEAMYMNNRAAEALSAGRTNDAYWWARTAVAEHPGYAPAYNTLGVVYQRAGLLAKAAQAFGEILARDPDNLIAMQNQIRVLAAAGRQDEANVLAARLAVLEPNPPYHYFNLGMAAMDRGEYREARELFAREVRRAPANHEFHFWLAMASLRLGDTRQAGEQLALARDLSTTIATRDRYAGKLQHLMLASRRNARR